MKIFKLKQLSEDVTVLLKIEKMDSIVEENGNSSNNIDDTNASGTSGSIVGHNLSLTASQQTPQQQQPAALQSTQQQINITNSNNSQNLAPPPQNQISVPASVAAAVVAGTVLTTSSNVVQYLSNHPHGLPVC